MEPLKPLIELLKELREDKYDFINICPGFMMQLYDMDDAEDTRSWHTLKLYNPADYKLGEAALLLLNEKFQISKDLYNEINTIYKEFEKVRISKKVKPKDATPGFEVFINGNKITIQFKIISEIPFTEFSEVEFYSVTNDSTIIQNVNRILDNAFSLEKSKSKLLANTTLIAEEGRISYNIITDNGEELSIVLNPTVKTNEMVDIKVYSLDSDSIAKVVQTTQKGSGRKISLAYIVR